MRDISKWSIDENAELSKYHCELCGFPMAFDNERKLRCVYRGCILNASPEKVILLKTIKEETADEIEVIGNRFENPEFLTAERKE